MGTEGDQKTAAQPKRLGRYRSLMLIGEGGMGRVELALETGDGGFERVVALKRMRPEIAKDARHTEMFLHEARLAALLSHPNVVHTLAFGEADGELYLAMEYVQGETLTAILDRCKSRGKKVDFDLGLEILEHVCLALHAAHELRDVQDKPLGLVHRDVTPANVMVSYDGHVKLLDFGVAKIETGNNLTRAGEVKGKMAYMSPEQAMGDPLDRRSDLYAVGALLYEVTTGLRMWGEGPELEIMRRMTKGEVPALVEAPEAIRALHARLVRPSPNERPKDAKEVAAKLRDARTSSPDLAGMMRGLFADDARDKREAINAAMKTSPTDTRSEALDLAAEAPPATLSSTPRPSTRTRSALWGAAVAVVALVALVGGSLAMRGAPSGTEVLLTDASRAVQSAAPLVSTAPAPTTQPQPRPSGSTALTTAPPPKAPPISTVSAKPTSSALAPKASSSSTPVIDVDTNPI